MSRGTGTSPAIGRRGFLCGAAGIAALFALGGAGACIGTSEGLIRPPGTPGTDELMSLCIRCDRCRGACPQSVIVLSSLEDGPMSMQTPKLDFTESYCDLCGVLTEDGGYGQPQCVAACPTGALQDMAWDEVVLGTAQVDAQECIAYTNNGGCDVCVGVCPYGAVSLDEYRRPVVEASLCNGCGYCECECPSHMYRSFSGSSNRGIYVRAAQ